jgi:hypothetical protein
MQIVSHFIAPIDVPATLITVLKASRFREAKIFLDGRPEVGKSLRFVAERKNHGPAGLGAKEKGH